MGLKGGHANEAAFHISVCQDIQSWLLPFRHSINMLYLYNALAKSSNPASPGKPG